MGGTRAEQESSDRSIEGGSITSYVSLDTQNARDTPWHVLPRQQQQDGLLDAVYLGRDRGLLEVSHDVILPPSKITSKTTRKKHTHTK